MGQRRAYWPWVPAAALRPQQEHDLTLEDRPGIVVMEWRHIYIGLQHSQQKVPLYEV